MKGATFFSFTALLLAGLTHGCKYLEKECPDGSGCIPTYWFCDGRNDCGDGSDESDCCPSYKFNCGNGQCIKQSKVCDGMYDCSNKKDEENCAGPTGPSPTGPNPTGTPGPVVCGSRKFNHDLTDQQTRHVKPFIVGGINAVRGSLPWQVSVQTHYGFHFCGGTIIGKRWILSAAHCFSDPLDGEVIVAGEHKLKYTDGSEQKIQIQKKWVHPSYNSQTTANDIALVKLAQEITFDEYTQPACIPFEETEDADYAPNDWLIISGWGSTRQARGPSNLQVATVPMISDSDCQEAYKDYGITRSMFCAGKLNTGGTDSCQGDSGGPVVKEVDGKFTVLGVVSWGIGCARPEFPGVYTRVARFQPWIQQTINNNS